ncbi:MAG: terminase family protein [Deltaproteobacteria bacterium]|nr:terminase family protein [Deltaproteobacteria bacterium]
MTTHLFENYRPHDGQKQLHRAGARFTAVCAGVRSGKTHGAAREFLRRVYADRLTKSGPLHYWAVAPTYDLVAVQQREILSFLSNAAPRLVLSFHQTDRVLTLDGDIRIDFKSAHRPELLVGVGLDGLWMDEAARVHPEAWKGSLRMRLSDRGGFALFSTTPLARNWFYDEIWQRADPRVLTDEGVYARVHFTTAQNTALPGLAAEVEQARRDLPPKYFAREYLAGFESFRGQVYEEFDPSRHVVSERDVPSSFVETRVGVDWGWRNPGAMIVVGRDGDGTWWAVDEEVSTRRPVDSSGRKETWVITAKKAERQIPSGRVFLRPVAPGSHSQPARRGIAREGGGQRRRARHSACRDVAPRVGR